MSKGWGRGASQPEGAARCRAAQPAATSVHQLRELKKASLEKQAATLLEKYQAVERQMLNETNAATKVSLQNQAEDLLKEYDKIETQLRQLT